MARKDEEYDWLNDPFDDKKTAKELEEAKQSASKKTALGCGCLVIVVAVAALIAYGVVAVSGIVY